MRMILVMEKQIETDDIIEYAVRSDKPYQGLATINKHTEEYSYQGDDMERWNKLVRDVMFAALTNDIPDKIVTGCG